MKASMVQKGPSDYQNGDMNNTDSAGGDDAEKLKFSLTDAENRNEQSLWAMGSVYPMTQ